MLTIPLYSTKYPGLIAMVDDSDFELANRYRWNPQLNSRRCYAITTLRIEGRKTTLRMHRLITGFAEVDHHDHNGLNNQRYNLRDATHAENCRNGRPHRGSSSRFRGVYWHKLQNAWRGYIRVDGHLHMLGTFASEEEAARVYDARALAAWGEFAYLNFPD